MYNRTPYDSNDNANDNDNDNAFRIGEFDVPMTMRVKAATPARASEIADQVIQAVSDRGGLAYYGVSSVAVVGEPAPYAPTTTITVTFDTASPEDLESIRGLLSEYAHYLPESSRSPRIESFRV